MKLDSNEELYFSWYLYELKINGFIEYYKPHPESFKLSDPIVNSYIKKLKTKDKNETEEVLKGHLYTTDFIIKWTEKARNLFFKELNNNSKIKESNYQQFLIASDSLISYIEVKPIFDQNNMTRLAKINQKWVWEKHNIFINIVIPDKHFSKTFTPAKYMITNISGKSRKIRYKPIKTLKEFINERL